MIILKSDSGFVVSPNNYTEICNAALKLISDESLRSRMEVNARKFAEENFSGARASQFFINLMSQE